MHQGQIGGYKIVFGGFELNWIETENVSKNRNGLLCNSVYFFNYSVTSKLINREENNNNNNNNNNNKQKGIW